VCSAAALLMCITYVSAEVINAYHRDLGGTLETWKRRRENHDGSGLTNAFLTALATPSTNEKFLAVLNEMLIPRLPGTANHTRVRNRIVEELRALGWSVDTPSHLEATPFGTERFTNIVATLDPEAPRRLVLACHYDSLNKPPGFIGATDSALPCAQLLGVALELKDALNRHRLGRHEVTLQLVFFDGEEAFVRWTKKDSLYGSRRLANQLAKADYTSTGARGVTHLHRIDLFVLLDLLGAASPRFQSYFFNTEKWYLRLVSFEKRLKNLGYFKDVPDMFLQKKFYSAGIQDDHIPFLDKKVPVLHIIPVPFPEVWHKRADNGAALDWPTIQVQNALWRALVADYLHLDL